MSALAPARGARPRPTRSGVGFTVFVAVAMFLGAAVMAFVLLASDAPHALVVGVLLAAIPVGPLVGCYVWLDRYEPEPRYLLVLGLGWGAFVATSSALVLELVGQYAFRAPRSFGGAFVAPLTEESMKGLFILLLLWFRRNQLDGILDGIVYAGMVGIGFAFTENILYLSAAYGGDAQMKGGIASAVGLFVVRGIFSPFAHPLFTAFTGIGVGIAVNTRSHLVRVIAPIVGLCIAILAHATWNAAAFRHGGRDFVLAYVCVMVPCFVVLASLALWARRHEARLLTTALADCARRGFIDPAEIPWLTRLSARRTARTNGRARAGKPGLAAMRRYQDTAIRLGFLHSRYLRGIAPPDFAARGQAYVDELVALRHDPVWQRAAGLGPTGAPQTGMNGAGVTSGGHAASGTPFGTDPHAGRPDQQGGLR